MRHLCVTVAAILMLTGCTSTTAGGGTVTQTATVTTTVGPSIPTTTPPSPSSSSPAATGDVHLGELVAYVDAVQGVAADITVSALKVAKPAEFYTVKGVLFQVTVVVVGVQGAYSANPLFFTARDAAGDSYSAEFGATATDLGSGDVRPGQKLRGTVAFDVPKGQKIALVILADPLGRQVGAWTA